MTRPLVSPLPTSPVPLLSRVAAHLASAERRDRVFTTLPVHVVRELLQRAQTATRPQQITARAHRVGAGQ
jgi:hypothetical protein